MPRYGHVVIEGLPRIFSLCKVDTLLASIWRDAMEEATSAVESRAEQISPRRSGHLRATITHTLQARPVPRWGKVTTNASRNGVRYPFVLQAGHRTPKRPTRMGKKRWRAAAAAAGTLIQLHYRSVRTGQSTRGWFNRALDEIQHRVNATLAKAARRIEERWNG